MPQGSNAQRSRPKTRGRTPAHCNRFAFCHNPKSRKTEKILGSPIGGVCRRCAEKLQWRKKYRKYKPLTQPAKCNICQERNVTQAYHTICTKCCTSPLALAAVEKAQRQNPNGEEGEGGEEEDARKKEEEDEEAKPQEARADKNDDETKDKEDNQSVATTRTRTFRSTRGRSHQGQEPNAKKTGVTGHRRRACGVCVKDYVAVGKKEEDEESKKTLQEEVMARQAGGRALKLREIKTLERQMMQQEEEEEEKVENSVEDNEEDSEEDNDDYDDDYDDEDDPDGDYSEEEEEEEEDDQQRHETPPVAVMKEGKRQHFNDDYDDNDEEEDEDDFEDALEDDISQPVPSNGTDKKRDDDDNANDPFLQAVGGKILVREEYRRAKLLQAADAVRAKASA